MFPLGSKSSKLLALIIANLFVGNGFLSAVTLRDVMKKTAFDITCSLRPSPSAEIRDLVMQRLTIESEFKTMDLDQALRITSNEIKAYLSRKGSLPIKEMYAIKGSGNGIFGELLQYKDEEGPLVERLLSVAQVAAAMVRNSILGTSPLDLNLFYNSKASYFRAKSVFESLYPLSPALKANSGDPILKRPTFLDEVECVFYAILPDVPTEYYFPKTDTSPFAPMKFKT